MTVRAVPRARRARRSSGLDPLPAPRKWRAITLATLVLVVAFWSLLVGVVAVASEEEGGVGSPAAAIAFGLALLPFVFIVLAFTSEHPDPPGAVLRAMALCILVGVPVSAIAADAVTGVVAGVGAGGVVALRSDLVHSRRTRAWAVVVAAGYAFALVRTAGTIALLPAPIFPLTAIGLADHLTEWRREREAAE